MKGKARPSSTTSCSYSVSVEEESENEKEIWICGKCNLKREVDSNRWIVCNKSDLPFHQLGISQKGQLNRFAIFRKLI